ncbi:MAG: preprotein translocase subunit SecY [Candidatus Staskawiczbacteria bacterium RIFCSPLOWO2_01_FULL_40_39]|uniref:Protein translocase subunit SecY n=1 Tax=Candidatus Staskawiczbacteria bacterium RIFCSPHIGHO2_01_FULL_39_25 TaxID=1802202 RepID=A0A1G2HQK7_9BACT|nr:MAG: preprotein translocase subunit SecY [Candidatus Staskawiczbacteria bacterium RIFCSPHIGHO2_01_FULL_39_25]OGZ72667.1 MAG: preprotein translocase subunit SecY [Candidatus Staskawiczbacteria bacterium RIFCSPLOWO2_01_FULL_40_39]OGZ75840.1 MAG: preprotein translocase subunit SecY [Candidatus Staskawiczbacteria bacterium RIFCSPLOWO2_02_FULL_39_8]
MWYEKILLFFKNKELRNKFLFVFGLFLVFRIAANVPIPGIGVENLRKFFAENQVFGLLNIFSGGALSNFSIVLLGLGPYITATIILQLLTMVFPALEKMYKEEGEAGRQKFNQYGRLLTIPLAVFEGYGMLTLFQRQGVISALSPEILVSSIITIVAGSMFLMWIGEIITEQGIGNGISLLIFAGIVARLPINIFQTFVSWDPSKIPSYILFFALSILIIAGVVLITEARRNIPVSYAKRVRGSKMYGGVSTYLPLNVNPAGVIPIIFALSILLFPSMVAGFFGTVPGMVGDAANAVAAFFNNQWVNGIFYFILVIMFTYFYTAVTFNPQTIAENLQKMGGFIPGVRPGRSTSEFLKHILNRVLFTGALSLGLIAVLPNIVAGITEVTSFTFLIGGTSLLIIVSVVLETMRQINAQLQMREYDTF